MSALTTVHQFHGLDAVEMIERSGSRVVILRQGAQLLSWQPAGQAEQLNVSPCATYAAGVPVRGGVPVVFPQFADTGNLLKHGFARTKCWTIDAADPRDDWAEIVFCLSDDADTRSVWPHTFALKLCIRLSATTLEMHLTCINPGHSPFTFTSALHTYLARDLMHTELHGLESNQYWDKVNRMKGIERGERLKIRGEIDRIYQNVVGPLTLYESTCCAQQRLELEQAGFKDVVVWNPGAERCARLPDMPPQGYRSMLCIEAAQIAQPVHLDAGQSWTGMQRLRLT